MQKYCVEITEFETGLREVPDEDGDYYRVADVDASNVLVYGILRQAIKDVLLSAGICLACGEMDEGDGEPEHAKDCWVLQARSLMESVTK